MDAVNEDSEWDENDDESDDDDDSDRSMGLDAQSFRSVTLPKANTQIFNRTNKTIPKPFKFASSRTPPRIKAVRVVENKTHYAQFLRLSQLHLNRLSAGRRHSNRKPIRWAQIR